MKLTKLMRGGKIGWVMLGLIKNPNQLGKVFALSDEITQSASAEEKEQFLATLQAHPHMQQAFQVRHRMGKIDLERLAQLPEGSLGYEFVKFLKAHDLNPADLRTIKDVDDVSYFVAHMNETHDLWHLLTGMDTDVPGEVGLQAFGAALYFSPFSLLLIGAGVLHAALLKPDLMEPVLASVTHGWRLGKSSRSILGVDWKTQWETPLEEIRKGFNLIAGEEKAA